MAAQVSKKRKVNKIQKFSDNHFNYQDVSHLKILMRATTIINAGLKLLPGNCNLVWFS